MSIWTYAVRISEINTRTSDKWTYKNWEALLNLETFNQTFTTFCTEFHGHSNENQERPVMELNQRLHSIEDYGRFQFLSSNKIKYV